MRRRSRKRKLFSNILAFLMLLAVILSAVPLLGLNFVRADTYLSGRTGSIQAILLSHSDGSGVYSGVSMKLYQVGIANENNGTVNFDLDSRFAGSGIKMDSLGTADKWSAAAQTLAEMVDSSGIDSIEGTSDDQGQISFKNLEQGVYLLVQSSAQERIIISPSLLTVPLQEDGQWIYDVKVYPKFTPDNAKYQNCTIKISKNVLKDGKKIKTDDTFYAGVFEKDEEGKTVLIKNVKLEQNGTVEVNIQLLDEELAEQITYTVKETDKNGKPVDKKEFPYAVSGEDDVILKKGEGYKGEITLTNSQSTTVPTTSNTSVITHQTTSTNVKSPKTGDNTQIILWIVLLAAAAAGGTFIVYRINKKNR